MPFSPLSAAWRAAVLAAPLLLLAACSGGETADSADAAPLPAVPTADAAPAAAPATPVANGAPVVTVYKSPSCGCCKAWVAHLQENGFAVVERDTSDVHPVKAAHGLPGELESCHTGIVQGYVIEGHVPADLVAKLLTEKPEGVVGLAVPGMPMGSPGMEGPTKEPYEVLAFTRDGRTSVYARR